MLSPLPLAEYLSKKKDGPPDNRGGGRNARCSVSTSRGGTLLGIYDVPTGYSSLSSYPYKYVGYGLSTSSYGSTFLDQSCKDI